MLKKMKTLLVMYTYKSQLSIGDVKDWLDLLQNETL
jgi:hypothetical protein